MAYSLELLEQLYEQCLSLPGEERLAFIHEACGDQEELRTVLLLMLENEQQSADYLKQLQQTLAGGISEKQPLPELATGDRLGNYRVASFLAKGGMSMVYLADRADGQYEQRVVIKCMTTNAFGPAASIPQIGEQQILARLRHPAIATLYDAGFTPDGIPYFVMEFIDGLPVDEWINHRNLNLNQILKIFEQIAGAVAYAHSHLILHLDLKPTNILVDSNGQVKLLDFGIATGFAAGKSSQRSFAGTPAIAAPEQLRGEPVSAATDVYQLGMLLHKLISGNYPLAEAASLSEGFTRFNPQSLIREPEIASGIRPEISAIIGKCLGKNPEERYTSPAELLRDIRNYQQHYPVTALPNSLKYRAFKYYQRHRTQVISITLIMLSLITGTVISLWQAGQAKAQRDLAVKSEEVSTATRNFLLDLFMAAHPSKTKGDTMTVFQFLDRGYMEAENYKGSPEIKLEMLTTIGKLYRSLGDYRKSKDVLDKVYAMAKDSSLPLSLSYVQAIQQLALYQRDMGNYDSASSIMKQVFRLYSLIGYPAKDSLYTASLKYHAYIYRSLENIDSATALIRKTIALEEQIWPDRNNINLAESYYILGVIQRNQGQFDEAITNISRSLELCEDIMGTYFPGTIANLNMLASTYNQAGNPAEALESGRRAKDIAFRLYGENHMETATTIDNLGGFFLKLNQTDSAYHYFKRGMNIRHKLFPERNNVHVMISTNNLLSLFVKTQQSDSVRKYLTEALKVGESPKVQPRQRAVTYWQAGEFYVAMAKPDSARHYYQKALAENRSYLPEGDERVQSVVAKLKNLGVEK
ncbi:Serine/threonine-protein kinase PknD [anaerobic digester metagenome]